MSITPEQIQRFEHLSELDDSYLLGDATLQAELAFLESLVESEGVSL